MRVGSAALFAAALLLTGCAGSWSYDNIKRTEAGARAPTTPAAVIVTENDITDRPYTVLADIEVTVNKTTIFNADPTRFNIDNALRERAASIGADAVIQVRYGTVGIGLASWGSLDGKGRAVAFKN